MPRRSIAVRLAKLPAAHDSGMLPVSTLSLSTSVVSFGKPPGPQASGSEPMKLWPFRKREVRDRSPASSGATVPSALVAQNWELPPPVEPALLQPRSMPVTAPAASHATAVHEQTGVAASHPEMLLALA